MSCDLAVGRDSVSASSKWDNPDLADVGGDAVPGVLVSDQGTTALVLGERRRAGVVGGRSALTAHSQHLGGRQGCVLKHFSVCLC